MTTPITPVTDSHKAAAIATFTQKSPVPAESHAKEFFKAVGHTFIGIAVVLLGVFGAYYRVPWYIWFTTCIAGFVIIAPRTIKGAFQWIIGAVRDAMATKAGMPAPVVTQQNDGEGDNR